MHSHPVVRCIALPLSSWTWCKTTMEVIIPVCQLCFLRGCLTLGIIVIEFCFLLSKKSGFIKNYVGCLFCFEFSSSDIVCIRS